MRSSVLVVLCLVAAALSVACSSTALDQWTPASGVAKPAMAPAAEGLYADAEQARQRVREDSGAAANRKIIRTAGMTLGVRDLDEAGNAIVALAESSGGFVLSSSRTHYAIKVPVRGFESALTALGELGEVNHKSLSGKDVTAEYVDLEVRLKNAREARDAYGALLRKATGVDEMLKVEQALRETQERIELLEGRRKFLDEHLALSQVNVNLKEKRTRGPLMLLWDGVTWLFGKLLWL